MIRAKRIAKMIRETIWYWKETALNEEFRTRIFSKIETIVTLCEEKSSSPFILWVDTRTPMNFNMKKTAKKRFEVGKCWRRRYMNLYNFPFFELIYILNYIFTYLLIIFYKTSLPFSSLYIKKKLRYYLYFAFINIY